MTKPKINDQAKNSEQGIVSIIVTIIIMVILSLVVIGFARIARREQRQILDRQLNSQAYYAAETGVNDAVKVINSGSFNTKKNYSAACNGNGSFIKDYSLTNDLEPTKSVSYTCLLVDISPSSLEFSNIDNTSKVMKLENTVDTPKPRINKIHISWQDKAGSTDPTNCAIVKPNWPTTAGWACPFGAIRVDLVRVDPNPPFSPVKTGSLNNGALTAFFMPSANNSDGDMNYAANLGYNNAGATWMVKCLSSGASTSSDFPKRCTAVIDNMGNGTSYILRIRSIYVSSAVTILAYDSSGNRISLSGVQALIDSTGKANDVLRRIQVRLPTNELAGPFPDFALQAVNGICKQLTVIPPPAGSGVVGSGADPSCDPLN